MSEFFTVTIDFRDGTTEEITYVSREITKEGVLCLYQLNNQITRTEEHLGSWPLDTIKKWKRTDR